MAGNASTGDIITSVIAALDRQAADIADRCTACGACAKVCPTPAIEGIDDTYPEALTNGIKAILQGHDATPQSRLWARQCCGSGFCQSVCQEGINPRLMLFLARRALLKAKPLEERRTAGKEDFKAMAHGVKTIPRLQLPPDVLTRLSPPAARKSSGEITEKPDIVFYTGCNLLKTPHIGLLCLDVLDALHISYQVHGGPASCCGILQMRTGDEEHAIRQAASTAKKLAASKTGQVISWCPTCQIQFGENLKAGLAQTATQEVAAQEEAAQAQAAQAQAAAPTISEITMFPVFLARHIAQLKPLLTNPVNKRIALHEFPGAQGVTEAVIALLSAIKGIEIVDLAQPRVGYQMSSLYNHRYAKTHLSDGLKAASKAGVDALVGVYHADHRELVRHEPSHPFEIVNYMELIGEALGVSRPDTFKRLRLMADADMVLAASMDNITAHQLDVHETRNAIADLMLAERVL